tara:strand:+ start:20 stop:235 length:216 start_codon:yes stop_codon:yes gene_type:complete
MRAPMSAELKIIPVISTAIPMRRKPDAMRFEGDSAMTFTIRFFQEVHTLSVNLRCAHFISFEHFPAGQLIV